MNDINNYDVVDHVTISVANLESSIQWYLSSFKCDVIYRQNTLAILKFENLKIVLSLPSDQRPHVGYLKQNAAEFGELMEHSDSCTSTFIADPTGNPVELVAIPFEQITK